MKALVTFVYGTVAKKNTFLGEKLKFMFIVWTKMGPTCTAKHFEKGIVWRFME
jgi:hypothetical protein